LSQPSCLGSSVAQPAPSLWQISFPPSISGSRVTPWFLRRPPGAFHQTPLLPIPNCVFTAAETQPCLGFPTSIPRLPTVPQFWWTAPSHIVPSYGPNSCMLLLFVDRLLDAALTLSSFNCSPSHLGGCTSCPRIGPLLAVLRSSSPLRCSSACHINRLPGLHSRSAPIHFISRLTLGFLRPHFL